jgi:mono/diheme cytochrome c family protein
MNRRRTWKNLMIALAAILILAVAGIGLFWWKFLMSEDQSFANATERFEYGSLGGDAIAGIPYAIFMVLPRVFPDLVARYATEGYGPEKAGFGGYGAFGLSWEEGQRLPIGLSIKRTGFERVTVTCALCHTTSYRLNPDDTPRFAVGGPAHTANIQGLIRFLIAASKDERFTAERLMPEVALQFKLDGADWLLYSAVIIPKTRLALHLLEDQLGWMNDRPAWGPGRDDAFNLPKFILTQSPWDHSVGNTDFPAVWGMAARRGQLLHWGGEAKTLYAVTATSALGTGALPGKDFEAMAQWTDEFISALAPPPYPAAIDKALAARGQTIFDAQCASCHDGKGSRVGTSIPLAEIGTDPEHVLTFSQSDAERMNGLTRLLGAPNAELKGAQGYVARPLIGVWLLAPYLHNGSVPTLRALLAPPDQRPRIFYRGVDLVDPRDVGFSATGPAAEAEGFRFDTSLKGNGNGGHVYGTDLSEQDKTALIEFLKTI